MICSDYVQGHDGEKMRCIIMFRVIFVINRFMMIFSDYVQGHD